MRLSQVRLVRGRALRQLVGKDAQTGEPSSLAKAGTIGLTVGLRLPIVRKILSRVLPAPEAHRTPLPAGSDQTDRRLANLGAHIAPVSRDVPTVITPTGLMDKSSDLAIKLRTWSAARADLKGERRLQIAAVRRGEASASTVTPNHIKGPITALHTGVSQVTGLQWDRQASLAERRAQKDAFLGRGLKRGDVTKQQLADHKQALADDRILWVVVLNADQDAIIRGREDADADTEQVVIGDVAWQEEVRFEQEEEQEEAELEADVKY